MRRNILIALLGILLISSCSGNSTKSVETNDSIVSVESKNELVLNNFYNDIALFIAGMPVSDSSIIKDLTEKKEWKDYSQSIDKSWSDFQKNKLEVMIPWVDAELKEVNNSAKTIFYPFSGPDFVYMYSFLPNAETYYMVALEPVGKIPNISKIENNLNSFFGALNNAIRDNLNLSFFITKSMKNQMNNEQIKGTIPVLLFFMARMNLHIQSINPVKIEKDGTLKNSKSDENSTDKVFSDGVEICFFRPNADKLTKLYYFSTSIRNDGFEKIPEAETFLKSLPTDMTTIVKSSSYCMHEDKYNKIRNIVLFHSKFLIQDDSGVPFRFFDSKKWDFNFYGIYTRPIPVFAHFYQDDLKLKWNKNAKKLDFRFGYNAESNIFVAKRK